MIVEDRYDTDAEIVSLYRVADLAWCRYAPGYDQASLVFGRALQIGVTPVLREGSVIADLARMVGSGKPVGYPAAALDALSWGGAQ